MIQERQRAANRLHKLLQDAGIKLASVATDILGVSGRAMLEALVQGTTDPEVLADLARGKLRKKLAALRQVLAGRFRPHHAFLVSQLLAHVDYLDEAITTVSEEVDTRLAPFASQLTELDTVHGIARRTASVIVAEIGVDMSRFPSDRHRSFPPGNGDGARGKALGYALDIRKFEIELYWKRAGYFWTLIAASFAGFVALQTATKPKPGLSFLISCIGLVLSFGWYLVNRGSKYWQENWERHVDMLETEVIGPFYKTTLSRQEFPWIRFWGGYPYSVSNINQLISLFISSPSSGSASHSSRSHVWAQSLALRNSHRGGSPCSR